MNRWLVALIAKVPWACTALPGDESPATPQRPTLSSDTSTVAQGTVELESGFTVDPGDLIDFPNSLKVGVGNQTELFADWSPYQRVEQPGSDARGQSDLGIGTRHRFLEESGGIPSAAFQFITKLPTGSSREGLSSGEVDFLAAGILTKTIRRGTLTAFYELGFLGEAGGADTDLQQSLALAGAYPLADRLTGYLELAGVFLGEQDDRDAVFSMFGLAYPAGEQTIFDAGAVVGLSDDAPDFQLVLGLTVNFGDVFRAMLGGTRTATGGSAN